MSEEWKVTESDDEEELEDNDSYLTSNHDAILFAINCSKSMLTPQRGQERSNLESVLQCAVDIEKGKVKRGPYDSVGILLFNTAEKRGEDVSRNVYLYQPVAQISAPLIKDLINLLADAEADPNFLREKFKPKEGKSVPLGEVFSSCNHVLREGHKKTAVKRIFFVTDDDDPHPGVKQLATAAQTNLRDLYQLGVSIIPFFISSPTKPFDPTKFYSDVLARSPTDPEANEAADEPLVFTDVLHGFDDVMNQMKVREMPKRSAFSVPLKFGDGFSIGVKGYGTITETKKGAYRYFANLGQTMEEAVGQTIYVDAEKGTKVDKDHIVFGMTLGTAAPPPDDDDDEEGAKKKVKPAYRNQVFFTAEELRSFRTLDLEPGIKILGFKDRVELQFEDNVKHSFLIYPNEDAYMGSTRTFTALLRSLLKKKKIGLTLVVTRRNSSPVFCAMVPQAETYDENGSQIDPPGFHLIPLPFADDIRTPPIDTALRGSGEVVDAAANIIGKMIGKKGYVPDAYPNPTLGLHYGWLEATAFGDEFDPETDFKDKTRPPYDQIHERVGSLLEDWKNLITANEDGNKMLPSTAKRKAAISVDEYEYRSAYDSGKLNKFKVEQLKAFCSQHGQPVSGKKDVLIERIATWLDAHPM